MSVRWRLVLPFTLALCSAIAHADLARVGAWSQTTASDAPAVTANRSRPTAIPAYGCLNPLPLGPTEADWLQIPVGAAVHPVAAQQRDPTIADDERPAHCLEIPPVPSSYALGLSALASLGVVQAGRSLRKLHVGFIPDWYHAGGPTQIGHTKVFDLEHSWSLAICPHVEVVRWMQPAYPPHLRESAFAVGGMRSPETLVPRGPPIRG